jgi:prepilin-type N-terminal cleavage/methylation domain-containing protein/prepilin-type processing-associated H-X9-DG protein
MQRSENFVVDVNLIIRFKWGRGRLARAHAVHLTNCAFTLVELLAVIAILGILAATLLPALNRAKQSAHLAKCASNLRQIELATTLYVMDNGTYPFYWSKSNDSVIWSDPWTDQLAGYLSQPKYWDYFSINSSNNAWWGGVFGCPGAPKPFVGTGNNLTWGRIETTTYFNLSSYGPNGQGTDLQVPRGIYGAFPEPGPPFTAGIIPPVREADIFAPSDMIAFGDACLYQLYRDIDHPVLVGWGGFMSFTERFGWGASERQLAGLQAELQRHHGLLNVAFCDAHVEALKPDKLYGAAPELTKRWNRDHQPHTDAWK